MREYYAKRNGLLTEKLTLSLDELNTYFLSTYRYFENKGYFEVAMKGAWRQIPYTNEQEQVLPPTMIPSPDVYFSVLLQSAEVWPIYQYIEYYDEKTLFSVIEILYDNIGVYNYQEDKYETQQARTEYSELINNILAVYKDGYYLEPKNGYIMNAPNYALKEQLNYSGEEMPENVFIQLSTASEMFYRFDSNIEEKKKAIAILADILENEREPLKELLNSEYEIGKNEHDKLIFGIVNGFNIRHNRADQKTDYSKAIWYDWMMQYYTSVIIAYYKLKAVYGS